MNKVSIIKNEYHSTGFSLVFRFIALLYDKNHWKLNTFIYIIDIIKKGIISLVNK